MKKTDIFFPAMFGLIDVTLKYNEKCGKIVKEEEEYLLYFC